MKLFRPRDRNSAPQESEAPAAAGPATPDGEHEAWQSLQRRNAATVREVQEFRRGVAEGRLGAEDHAVLKQKHPYYGVVSCSSAGIDYLMFHAHDDVVAWHLLWFGPDSYETEIVNTWVEWSRDAQLVYDIGAYTGLMTLLSLKANPSAEVHLFEPMERTIERAYMNLRLNGVQKRVHVHPVAVSDSAGEAQINLYRPENFLGTGNSIYDKGLPIPGTKSVSRVVLDEYLPDLSPDLVKIDVEGHELAVLRGLADTITRARPRMIVEIWEHERSEVLALLESWGYTCTPFEREQRVMNFACVPAGPSA